MVAVSYNPSPHRRLGQGLIALGILLAFVIRAMNLSTVISLLSGSVLVILGAYLMRGGGGMPIQRPIPGIPIVRCDHCGRSFYERTDRCPNCDERTTLIFDDRLPHQGSSS